jgi:hypothetical protein
MEFDVLAFLWLCLHSITCLNSVVTKLWFPSPFWYVKWSRESPEKSITGGILCRNYLEGNLNEWLWSIYMFYKKLL